MNRFPSRLLRCRLAPLPALASSLLVAACTTLSSPLGFFGSTSSQESWKDAVDRQISQLGYRNWIVVAEASFPAHSRQGLRQVVATAEVPEVVDYVLTAMERTEHVRPRIFVTRELRAIENQTAPGIDEFRRLLTLALHAHETTELDQQALLTLIESATHSFDVLVIRTATALPYTSVFMELQPGYWDAESEDALRSRLQRERIDRLARPHP